MFNWLRDEQGSTLGMVLILALIVSVIGIGAGQYIYNNNKQTQRNLDATQAHYYAKSGVETAVGLVKANLDELDNVLEETYHGKIGDNYVKTPADPADHNIEFKVNFDGVDTISINARGIVRSGNNAMVSSEQLEYTISLEDLRGTVGTESGGGGVPMALFAKNGFEIYDGATIDGNVATNLGWNNITFRNQWTINGDIYIGPNENLPENLPSDNFVKNLSNELSFPEPIFPNFNFNASNNTISSGTTISLTENVSSYKSIDLMDSTLIIDLNYQTRYLIVDNLNLTRSPIKLINVGESGNLILVVNNLSFNASKIEINTNGKPSDLNLYYAGNNPLEFSKQDTKFVGSIFTKQANVKIHESATVIGDIVSGGNKIEIFHNQEPEKPFNGLLYAPNANLEFNSNGSIQGIAIVSEAKLPHPNVKIISDYSIDLSFFNSLNWPSGKAPSLTIGGSEGTPGEGIWQRYGKWSLVSDG